MKYLYTTLLFAIAFLSSCETANNDNPEDNSPSALELNYTFLEGKWDIIQSTYHATGIDPFVKVFDEKEYFDALEICPEKVDYIMHEGDITFSKQQEQILMDLYINETNGYYDYEDVNDCDNYVLVEDEDDSFSDLFNIDEINKVSGLIYNKSNKTFVVEEPLISITSNLQKTMTTATTISIIKKSLN